MLAHNKLAVLASFFPNIKEKTAKEIEKTSELSHEPIFRLLKSLVKEKYIKEKKIGGTNVYELVRRDDLFLIYTYFMTEKIKKFKEKHPLKYKRIKEFIQSIEAISVILFGSYAKGTEIETSDIDILVVSHKREAEKTALTFKTKYNVSFNIVIIKPSDFKNIKKDNSVFYDELVTFGIVFYGIEFFFNGVYHEIASMVY